MSIMGTLYVQTKGIRIRLSNDNIIISSEDGKQEIPIKLLDGIIIEGDITLTSPLICSLIENGVQITFLNIYEGFKCSIHPDIKGNVAVRHNQLRLSDDKEKALSLGKSMVYGKCHNQIAVIERDIRNYGDITGHATELVDRMNRYLDFLKIAKDTGELMGYEGNISRIYFSYFNTLIRQAGFEFKCRSYNPPRDNINSALSYAYALLRHEVEKDIHICGLDPYVGFIHSELSGKSSLALDLMEEFRPFMCDRLVISAINNKSLSQYDFSDDGAIIIGSKNKSSLIKQWEAKKRSKIRFNNKIMTYSEVILEQVRLLVRHIKGIDTYKPYIWR